MCCLFGPSPKYDYNLATCEVAVELSQGYDQLKLFCYRSAIEEYLFLVGTVRSSMVNILIGVIITNV